MGQCYVSLQDAQVKSRRMLSRRAIARRLRCSTRCTRRISARCPRPNRLGATAPSFNTLRNLDALLKQVRRSEGRFRRAGWDSTPRLPDQGSEILRLNRQGWIRATVIVGAVHRMVAAPPFSDDNWTPFARPLAIAATALRTRWLTQRRSGGSSPLSPIRL
jgi:hypothetical protein